MKLKTVIVTVVVAMSFSSCVLTHTALVTNNPVGSKVGVATAKPFQKDMDISFKKAKENGDISKVGVAEFKVTQFIFPSYKTTVTGE
jgi:hypothetical protein